MKRAMLFTRDFHGYSGGHGKVWDYFGHVDAHAGWSSQIHFSHGADATGNPWRDAGVGTLEAWCPERADALFLAGMDWTHHPADDQARPVINLIQGMRHADPSQPPYAFLQRPAIRICVGQPIADAILATGRVRGPVHVIDSGLSLPPIARSAAKAGTVLIAGHKQPDLAKSLATLLENGGVDVDLLIEWLPRDAFLRRMQQASIVVALPLASEGFFLPALESMALGRATVVPDCVGNRAYLEPGSNALVPEMSLEALEAAVHLLRTDEGLRQRIANNGLATHQRFGIDRERATFHGLLHNIGPLWTEAWTATSP